MLPGSKSGHRCGPHGFSSNAGDDMQLASAPLHPSGNLHHTNARLLAHDNISSPRIPRILCATCACHVMPAYPSTLRWRTVATSSSYLYARRDGGRLNDGRLLIDECFGFLSFRTRRCCLHAGSRWLRLRWRTCMALGIWIPVLLQTVCFFFWKKGPDASMWCYTVGLASLITIRVGR